MRAAVFQIQLPQKTVPPGGAGTCTYYTRAPVTTSIAVKRWSSTITAATHHVIAYATYKSTWVPLESYPPGTLRESTCVVEGGSGRGGWLYAAHRPTQDIALPSHDGIGMPLAMEVVAGQPLCVEIYIPTSDNPMTGSAMVHAEGLPTRPVLHEVGDPPHIQLQPRDLARFHDHLPADVPDASRREFWRLSTRTRRSAKFTRILDGSSPLLENPDWDDPASATFTAPAFTIYFGEDNQYDELCLGIGYFFPAQHPAFRMNNVGPH